jgi:hypothetical protein
VTISRYPSFLFFFSLLNYGMTVLWEQGATRPLLVRAQSGSSTVHILLGCWEFGQGIVTVGNADTRYWIGAKWHWRIATRLGLGFGFCVTRRPIVCSRTIEREPRKTKRDALVSTNIFRLWYSANDAKWNRKFLVAELRREDPLRVEVDLRRSASTDPLPYALSPSEMYHLHNFVDRT